MIVERHLAAVAAAVGIAAANGVVAAAAAAVAGGHGLAAGDWARCFGGQLIGRLKRKKNTINTN